MKDESDVRAIIKANSFAQRKIHNVLTNRFRSAFSKNDLPKEGGIGCMFDILIEKYDNTNDLLIEVKSSSETSHVRMAIGQLFDYQFKRKYFDGRNSHLAVLLPDRSDEIVEALLRSLDINLIWISENNKFESKDKRLNSLIKKLNGPGVR